ncbi:adenine nucleotide alpha hydrolases-like protein [Lophiostoma macrostomum CBS 122681]|uniref:Adenine nucleotide alpha hydrolases-like protein n=1 Tax=Lophiostoma macrostomum CBS 122681 TaxID=1314788 RepID=A0A6A6SRD4_9PLEO|nr:adenine nucleotide alpha hydrolases-like protein [Lophiostoma macrostomum CBS 122681]
MSVSPTSNDAPRTASPAIHGSALPTIASPLLLPAAGVDTQEPRRPSIQFLAHSNAALPRGSPKPARVKRRISSPPPPPVFQPRVSFDTFDRPAEFIEENSFTLIAKHKDYEYTKRSRTFLCGCDDNEYSEYALQWLIDELVDDGDEIVCLRVVEKDDAVAGDRSVEKGRYRSEAEVLMKAIQNKNHENKAINLILEFALGKVNKVIDEMINLYEPAILVVGTRGRSLGGFQGLLPGSVSKYCLQHSPVPVIVVRPSSKRDKARVKRALDPSRHGYKDLLEKAGPNVLDASHRNSFILEEEPASDDEAAAVAAAIGYKPQKEKSPLVQVQAAQSKDKLSLDDFRSPGVVMKSPDLQNLDSPELSEVSSSDEEDQGGVSTTTSSLAQNEQTEDQENGDGGFTDPLVSDANAIREALEKQTLKNTEET